MTEPRSSEWQEEIDYPNEKYDCTDDACYLGKWCW